MKKSVWLENKLLHNISREKVRNQNKKNKKKIIWKWNFDKEEKSSISGRKYVHQKININRSI